MSTPTDNTQEIEVTELVERIEKLEQEKDRLKKEVESISKRVTDAESNIIELDGILDSIL